MRQTRRRAPEEVRRDDQDGDRRLVLAESLVSSAKANKRFAFPSLVVHRSTEREGLVQILKPFLTLANS